MDSRHARGMKVLGSMPATSLLKNLDYSVLQQCMHCGMCLPTCPTYMETKQERNSPRGRIALMRAVADDELEVTKALSDEMYYCLGCLACQTACPAGVNYVLGNKAGVTLVYDATDQKWRVLGPA